LPDSSLPTCILKRKTRERHPHRHFCLSPPRTTLCFHTEILLISCQNLSFSTRKVSSIIILYFLGHIALIMEFNQKQDNFEVPKTTNSMKVSFISVRMRLTNTLSLLETWDLSYKGLIVVNEAIKKEARKYRTYFFQHCPFKNIYSKYSNKLHLFFHRKAIIDCDEVYIFK
jgi:hypothetical protein